MNTLFRGITLLLRSGITGEKLMMPEDFSLEEAIPVLKKHSVAVLAYQGAVNCGLDKKHPVMQQMLQLSYRTLLYHEKQARALDALLAAFEENAILHVPVKGCNMKRLYPKPEQRPMGDADILIREEDYHRIRPIMEAQGYSLVGDTSHVYEWRNADLLVELHKSLVVYTERDFYEYYGTGWRLAQKGEGARCDLSLEDSYVFTFVHLAKHYRGGGIGCRHMVDLYVCNRACPQLDRDYISGELEKLKLREFYEHIMRTLDVWFAEREPDPVTELITEYVFNSGNWGNTQNRFLHRAFVATKKKGKARGSGFANIVRTVFPPYESMAYGHKSLRMYPVLLPVFWVVRWYQLLMFRRKSIRTKLRALKNVDDEGIRAYEESLRIVGVHHYFDKMK